MEKVLRRKFVLICMAVVFGVLSIIAIVVNIANFYQINRQTVELIDIIYDNDGIVPSFFDDRSSNRFQTSISPEISYTTRYFIVKINEENVLIDVDTNNISAIDDETAISYAEDALYKNRTSGFIGDYKYKIINDYGETSIIFLDCSEELYMFKSFLFSIAIIYFIALIAIFILVVVFSKKAVAPIVQSYMKQKQFITDMSHEIKTPLAIIKANTEVLELDMEDDQWTKGIHNQIDKLTKLVNALLSLSKLDEGKTEAIKSDFSITDTIMETAQPFNVLNPNLYFNINKNISYNGDEQAIRTLISILLENAIKYGVNEKGIYISVKENKNKIIIEIRNAVNNITIGNYDKWFERFYREENSRNSETGGFGIGLAMAKSIVKKHNGKISAESYDGETINIKIEL